MPVTAYTPKSLLQIVNAALGELGLPQLATVVGNTDPAAIQMLALLNAEGEELRDTPDGGWTSMQTEYNLIVNPPVLTTGDVVENSPVITNIVDTTGVTAGSWAVIGDFLPTAARVLSVDSATQVTMTMEAIGSEVGASITFAQDTYPLPADFKSYIGDTWWDRTNRWQLLGPDSPQLDQWHLSGIVTTGPRRHWRQLGNTLNNQYRLWPPPVEIVEPLQLVYEYVSTNWVNMTGSVTSTGTNFQFTADTDTSFLDDRALIEGLKWRFKKIKGYGGWEDDRNDYVDLVDRLSGRDGGSKSLSLVRRASPLLISPSQVQDGFFPGPTGPNMS